MFNLMFFLFSLLTPWVLGCMLIKIFWGNIKVHQVLIIGAGYVFGWFSLVLLLFFYDYIERIFDIYEILLIQWGSISFLLLLFYKHFLPLKKPTIEMSFSYVNILSFLMIFLLVYRYGLTAIDLLNKPVFPWDGWWAWSAKAKVFYYYQGIPELSNDTDAFWQYTNANIVSVQGANDPHFIPLMQTYTAMSWGKWDDTIINLPWLGLGAATFFSVLGFFYSLGAKPLPSVVACYIVLSLPILDSHLTLGSYADIWVGLIFLLSSSFLLMFVRYRKNNILLLLLIFMIMVYFIKHTAFVFLFVFLPVVLWLILGKAVSIILYVVFGCVVLMLGINYTEEINGWLITSGLTGRVDISYNPVFEQVWREWILRDNWHYIVFFAVMSLIFLPLNAIRRDNYPLLLLIFTGLNAMILMLFLTFFTTKMSADVFVGYFNRVTLYFMPVFALIPISVYCLITGERSRNGRKYS